MKKMVVLASLALTLNLTAGLAAAESIEGRIGITGRIGFLNPASSEVIPAGAGSLQHVATDAGLYGGGGIIYGIKSFLAADLEVTHSSFGGDLGDSSITDIALGAQYRFDERHQLTPYAGVGADILINDLDRSGLDVDTVMGVHVKGGVDYFLNRQVALNVEMKSVLAPTADIKVNGAKIGNFDASSFSGTVGVRFFFN